MQADVVLTAAGLDQIELSGKIVVVFDVLRATSTITTALQNGCRLVIPVLTPEEALATTTCLPTGTYLLGGERDAQKIFGFDLGNSPDEYQPDVVRDKTLIITTTNGTQAIGKALAGGAKAILAGSLLNVGAIAQCLSGSGEDVILACAGTKGQPALEDTLAAGAILNKLDLGPDELTTVAGQARELFLTNRQKLSALVKVTTHGQRLTGLGLEHDIDYCLRLDIFNVVPWFDWQQKGLVSIKQ